MEDITAARDAKNGNAIHPQRGLEQGHISEYILANYTAFYILQKVVLIKIKRKTTASRSRVSIRCRSCKHLPHI